MHKVLRSSSAASLMLSYPGRGNPTMNSKRGLITVLVGLAMLATPIAAAAKDHNQFDSHTARVSRHEFRNGATWMPAPAVVARHDWHENKHEWKHGWNGGAYQNYGSPGYYAAPAYVATPVYPLAASYYGGGYGGGGGGGQGCNGATRIMRTYQRDRATGHPAAAASLIRQNQWALHSGCATGAPGGRGLFGLGGQGGYRGVPAYNNGGYGGGYGQPGYGGGYGQPGYRGGGMCLSPQQGLQ